MRFHLWPGRVRLDAENRADTVTDPISAVRTSPPFAQPAVVSRIQILP